MSALNLKILDDKLEREKDYWTQKLSGDLVAASLRADFKGRNLSGHSMQTVEIRTDAETEQRLRSLCGNNESLTFAALATALKICLHKYTGHEDIIVGTTIHERYRETASFNRLLALRTHVSGSMTAKQLLSEVKDTLSEAYMHQNYPFEKILQHLNADSGALPFRVAVLLENINRRENLSQQNTDLTLAFSIDGSGLRGTIDYAATLFKEETIELFSKHYQEILRTLVSFPDLKIAKFELLSKTELEQLVFDYNRTEQAYPRHKTIHQLFEEQVERTPESKAATFGQQHLTYAELNRKANQLAHRLQRLGIDPGARAGIYLEHSLETLIAILGVLKAGGAYVPIDPWHPAARVAFMLEDAEISVVLTQRDLAGQLPATDNTTLICLDSDWSELESEAEDNPAPRAKAEDLAYVIYTSGSTGAPKGVKIQHRALINYIWWAKDVYLQDERLDFPLYSSLAFDLTVTSIYTPLITGNRVVIYRPDRWQSPLVDILKDNEAGVLKLTPSHLLLIKDADNSQSTIKRLIVGGEAFDCGLAKQIYESFGGQIEIFNEYGPTEATVGCMIYQFDPAEADFNSVPIGRPAANVQIYVLDEHLAPIAENVTGELYISGDGLASGYLNRDDLTAEKFIDNPFVPDQRMYRSGDLARWLPDQQLEYVGRKDEQVKFHGHRVELNEIRSALNRYPGIRDSVVVVRDAGDGRDVMIAYYASRQEFEPRALREFMSKFIVEETLPNIFVHMKKLPLTLNGKVNLKALPDVEQSRAQAKRTYQAAQTPVQSALVNIWEEVLGVRQAGIDDNFFELGGHSLLATQLISRVRELFQVELQVRHLFAEPTVKALAIKIEEQLRSERVGTEPRMMRASRSQSLPLSFAQQRLWFIDQLEPGSSLYNVPVALRLEGILDVTALEETLNEIIRRHESLRTTFVSVDGEPVQLINSPARLGLMIQDLSSLEDSEAEALRLARQEAWEPFDLSRGPLLRVKLLRLSQSHHVLLLTLHHIVADGWSIGVLIKEAGALYEAFARGERSSLKELSIQYADFAVWQRNWLQGEALAAQIQYWKQHLAGAPPKLELPVDHPYQNNEITHRVGRVPITLSGRLTEDLRALSRDCGVTLFMTLLAAWQALLSRYSNQKRVVVGTVIANRNRTETEDLIGFFVNTFALHTDLSGHPTFVELLERVKEVCLGAYAHQDLPFEKVVEELQPERRLSQTPFFQVMFVMQNVPLSALELPGLQLSLLDCNSETAKFQLLLDLQETSEGISGSLQYDTDLFEAATIKRMVGHLQNLLAGVAANPQQQLSRFSLLSAAEERELAEWTSTGTEYPRNACVHELFEEQVERTPNATALIFNDQQLTYRELNERANQLAHYLRSLGVGPDSLVGICVERSVEMIVGMLGIVKAGGAYVPLDPSYPAERLAYMLADAKVSLLLTQVRLVAGIPGEGVEQLCLDTDWSQIAQHSVENPQSEVNAENLAYVMYTSGSTGRPKGVSVVHRGVVRLVKETNYIDISADDVFLQSAPVTFDAATFEIWGSLLNGARLVLLPVQQPTLAELAKTISEHRVTMLWLTTGLFHLMVEEQSAALEQVRRMLAGGDVPSVEHVRKYLAQMAAEGRLINCYGPTENTTFTCCHVLQTESDWEGSVPIGRPIANTQVYLLDEQMRRVPIGVEGELYTGGDGLARDYLNRPDLTAEKFVPNPFSEAGERLYRTGDVTRWRNDGSIQFIGRVDHQVKVRGFRIELGEIESVLLRHEQIREAVVVARESESGDKQLVAYLAAAPEVLNELRSYLKEQLPDYMIPNAFVVLANLPLNSNGKVDRKALPAPKIEGAQGLVEARTAVEEMLIGIWSGVLRLETIGIDDDFFELGGHSLLATQVMSRVREAFKVEVPLRAIFESPTVQAFAERIEESLKRESNVEAPPILPVSRDHALPLSFAQQRLWFVDQLEPATALYNVPVAVRLHGDFNVTALQQTLDEVVRRHESLRTTFVSVDGDPVQVIGAAERVSVTVIDLSGEPEREASARRIAEEEAIAPFDLSRGPLLRTHLLRLGPDDHLLLLTTHHIVTDGWSMNLLTKEIFALYEAFSQGALSPLPELGVQYADFAHWQRNWLAGVAGEKQLAYWRDQLSGAPTLLELPTDKPRPAIQTFRGAHHPFMLSTELSAQLRKLSRREGVTMFMTLLAAFQTLLWKYSGMPDIVVGADVANRNRHETEKLIGFFVNMLVLRTRISGEENFSQLLRQVREVCLGAYAHQDLPFEKLVEELQPERSLSHTPLFQVHFTFQKGLEEECALTNLSITPMDVDPGVTQFDLALGVTENGNQLTGTFGYNTDLFGATTIQRMTRHLVTLLEAVVSNPDQKTSKLDLSPNDEKRQLLVDFNATATQLPLDVCFHRLFEEQVDKTPDAVAVEFGGKRLTYRQLNQRANCLARTLSELGVRPEILVALIARRGIDFLTTVLAIFKAGGSYLPLDPQHPSRRLAQVLSQSRSSLVLAADQFCDVISQGFENISSDERPRVFSLEDLLAREQAPENLAPFSTPGNLAYVIYTSGSTGTPKGAMLEQRGMCNHLWSKVSSLQLTAYDTVAQTASQSFDVSVWQMLSVLLVGGRVLIADDDLSRDAVGQLECVAKDKVTILEIVPSQLRMMVEAMGSTDVEARPDLSSLKWLIVNGEPLTPELCRQWFSLYPQTRLINAYGPTECSDDVTQCVIDGPPSPTTTRMPIGSPLANMRMYVLDEKLSPVPLGVPGELYIGGIGVGRGYLGEPARTAEIFRPDSFSQQPGARLYKTGDRVRWLPDGNLDFIERIDHQVKVRGYRIELGEIEAALNQLIDIKECAVVVTEDVQGLKMLVAYFVPEQEATPITSELSFHLKELLPAYMIPSVFVPLAALPLTSNGKLDRSALPAPVVERRDLDQGYVSPRTQAEKILVELWQEVLGMPEVGIEDNFFDLGGHSLLATRLMSRVRKAFGVDMPLWHLFESPTIRQLAEHIQPASTFSALVKIQSGNSQPPFFCVHPSGGNVLCYAGLARHVGVEQSFYGLQSWGLGEGNSPHTTVEEMAAHYLQAIRAVQPHGPYFLGGWSMGGVVAFEIAQQLQKRGESIGLLALIDSQSPSHASLSNEEDLRQGFAQDMGLDLNPDLEPHEFQRLFELYKINISAMLTYTPQSKRGRVTLFRAAERATANGHDPTDGWRAFAGDGVEVHFVPGNHFNIIREPLVKTLAAQLRTALDAATKGTYSR